MLRKHSGGCWHCCWHPPGWAYRPRIGTQTLVNQTPCFRLSSQNLVLPRPRSQTVRGGVEFDPRTSDRLENLDAEVVFVRRSIYQSHHSTFNLFSCRRVPDTLGLGTNSASSNAPCSIFLLYCYLCKNTRAPHNLANVLLEYTFFSCRETSEGASSRYIIPAYCQETPHL